MKRLLLGGLLVILVILLMAVHAASQPNEFVQSFQVHNHETFSHRGVQFLELRSSKGTILLSGDKDLEIIKFLKSSEGTRIIVSVEVPIRGE